MYVYIYISWYILRMQKKRKHGHGHGNRFFFGKVRWLFPFHISKRFASNFRPTSKKATGAGMQAMATKKKWKQPKNQKTILDVNFRGYIDSIPTLIHSFDEQSRFFFRRCLAMMVSPSPPPLQQRSRDLPPGQDLDSRRYRCLQQLQPWRFGQGHCWKSGGSSLIFVQTARSSKWSILDKSQIDLADLKKAAPI